MKLLKKILSAVAVAALVISVFPVSAQAASSKMLKVDPQKEDIPKVKFMLADLVGEENVTKVMGIEYDLVIERPGDTWTEWNGGAAGAGPWSLGGWANGTEWSFQDDTTNIAGTHLSNIIPEGLGFTDPATSFFMFMNWGNGKGVNINYIDNITFLDASGNALAVIDFEDGVLPEGIVMATNEDGTPDGDPAILSVVDFDPEAASSDEAPADPAPSEETADASADVPKTGVVGLGIVYGLGALTTGTVLLKRKEK